MCNTPGPLGGRERKVLSTAATGQRAKQSQHCLPSGLGLGLDWATGPTPQQRDRSLSYLTLGTSEALGRDISQALKYGVLETEQGYQRLAMKFYSPGGCKQFPSPELQPPESRAGPESLTGISLPTETSTGTAPILQMGGGRGAKLKRNHPPGTFRKPHQPEENSSQFAPPSLALAVPPHGRRRPEPRLRERPSPPVSSDPGAFPRSQGLGRSTRPRPEA